MVKFHKSPSDFKSMFIKAGGGEKKKWLEVGETTGEPQQGCFDSLETW